MNSGSTSSRSFLGVASRCFAPCATRSTYSSSKHARSGLALFSFGTKRRTSVNDGAVSGGPSSLAFLPPDCRQKQPKRRLKRQRQVVDVTIVVTHANRGDLGDDDLYLARTGWHRGRQTKT